MPVCLVVHVLLLELVAKACPPKKPVVLVCACRELVRPVNVVLHSHGVVFQVGRQRMLFESRMVGTL